MIDTLFFAQRWNRWSFQWKQSQYDCPINTELQHTAFFSLAVFYVHRVLMLLLNINLLQKKDTLADTHTHNEQCIENIYAYFDYIIDYTYILILNLIEVSSWFIFPYCGVFAYILVVFSCVKLQYHIFFSFQFFYMKNNNFKTICLVICLQRERQLRVRRWKRTYNTI